MKFMNSIIFDLQVQNWNLMDIWRKSLYNYLPSCRTRSRTRWTCPNERGRNMSNHLQRVPECVRSQDTFKRVHPSLDFSVDTLNMSRNMSRNMSSIVRGFLGHVLNVSGFFWTRSNVSHRPDTFKRVQNMSNICDEQKCSKNKVLSQVHEK